MARIGAVPWIAASLGAALVWAAVANKNPLDMFVAALSPGGEQTRPIRPIRIPPVDGGSLPAGFEGFGSGLSGDVPTESLTAAQVAQLVRIGQGEHRLSPAAAASFKRWERAFGETIRVTDSYRSTAQQAASYAAAEARGEHGRFAKPGQSWHERGLAVDVNLGAVGAGGGPGTSKYDRLRSTGQAAGWCWPRAAPQGDGKEPWHASFGGCG